tara:strand:+ start:358 stop:498 length:141 start_codon:yes stop_codon:yes gene_type:complete
MTRAEHAITVASVLMWYEKKIKGKPYWKIKMNVAELILKDLYQANN